MPSVVTVEELKDYMSNITLDADQETAAEMVLEGVEGKLERFFGRPVIREERTETAAVDDLGYVELYGTPVISIAGVLDSSGDPVDADAYEVSRGRMRFGVSSYSYALYQSNLVTVTYTGGLDGVNEPDIKLAVLDLSSRIMQNKHDDSMTQTDLATTGPQISQKPEFFTEEELLALDRFRRRMVL